MPDDPGSARRARFDALWGAHYAAVVAYARRRHPASARDVAADTFLVAWRRLDEVPASDARPWLLGVARRSLANHLRGERRRRSLIARLAQLPAEAAPDPAEMVGDPGVREAFGRLRLRDREVIALAVWEGLDAAGLGVTLGCSTRAATVRLHRARARLRAVLEEAADERYPVGEEG